MKSSGKNEKLALNNISLSSSDIPSNWLTNKWTYSKLISISKGENLSRFNIKHKSSWIHSFRCHIVNFILIPTSNTIVLKISFQSIVRTIDHLIPKIFNNSNHMWWIKVTNHSTTNLANLLVNWHPLSICKKDIILDSHEIRYKSRTKTIYEFNIYSIQILQKMHRLLFMVNQQHHHHSIIWLWALNAWHS